MAGSSEHGAGVGWNHARGSQAIVAKVAKPQMGACTVSDIAYRAHMIASVDLSRTDPAFSLLAPATVGDAPESSGPDCLTSNSHYVCPTLLSESFASPRRGP